MVRPHELFFGQLVDRPGEPLREPAAVSENDRGAMLANELEEARMNGRPDGSAADGRGRALRELLVVEAQRLSEPGHILDRHLDSKVERFPRAGVDDAHGTSLPGIPAITAAKIPGDLIQGSLRG